MKFTEKEISALVSSVEKEFAAHLSKAEETLAKSESATSPLVKAEDAKAAPDKEAKADKKAAHSEEKPEHKEEKKEEGKDAAPAQESSEEKPDAKEAPAESKEHAPEHDGADNEEGHDYDEQDMEHMHKMYGSMKKGELRAHHDSIKKCMDSMKAAPGMEMAKSETVVEVKPEVIKVVAQDSEILKSELQAEKAKSEILQKNLDAVAGILTKLVQKTSAPQAKAITSMDAITKSEGAQDEEKPLTKSEIDSALTKKSMGKLEKSDRDAINAYYLQGASFNTISHLLK